MITVTKTDSAVQFEFDGSQHYLYDGTMEVPFNSLILVEDESDMITFRKASTNDILFSAMYTEFSSLGNTKDAVVSALEDMMFAEGGGSGSGVTPSEVNALINSAITQGEYINNAEYISSAKTIVLYQDETEVATIDATAFIKDGMVDSVTVSGSILTIVFNTDAGKEPINVDLSDVVDLSNYWTSAQTQSAINQASSGKQDTLISGTNIKTINNESLLGAGNITISGDSGSNIIELTQAEYDALVDKDPDALYIISDAEEVNLSGYALSSAVTAEISAAVSGKADSSAVTQSLSSKQDTLVSGQNIKTINNQSLLGSGNITIGGGGGSYVYYSEDTTGNTATIHIENTDDGTTGEVFVDGASAGMYASSSVEEEGSTIETNADTNVNNGGIGLYYEKIVDNDPTTHTNLDVGENNIGLSVESDVYPNPYSHLNMSEGNISLEASSDVDHTTTFAVSNSAVTINGENVVTEDQLADYQPLLSAGTGINITNNVISATGGGGVTVDPSLDSGSTNPVANSAITTAIDAKANKTDAFGSYSFGATNNVGYIRYRSVSNDNIGNEIYYPKINGISILTTNGTWAKNVYNFQLVETSAITTSMTSSSTDAQVPSAKAVYDQLGGLKFVSLTQAEYDALATKDSTTIYFIKNNSN